MWYNISKVIFNIIRLQCSEHYTLRLIDRNTFFSHMVLLKCDKLCNRRYVIGLLRLILHSKSANKMRRRKHLTPFLADLGCALDKFPVFHLDHFWPNRTLDLYLILFQREQRNHRYQKCRSRCSIRVLLKVFGF